MWNLKSTQNPEIQNYLINFFYYMALKIKPYSNYAVFFVAIFHIMDIEEIKTKAIRQRQWASLMARPSPSDPTPNQSLPSNGANRIALAHDAGLI